MRIQRRHIATLQSHRRDEPYNVAGLLHGGELPVGAVTTAAHGPGDEGAGDPRLEANGGECCAVFERTVTNFRQILRESEGSDPTTSLETLWANCNQRFRESERGECFTVFEGVRVNGR